MIADTSPAQVSHIGECIGLTQKNPPVFLLKTTWSQPPYSPASAMVLLVDVSQKSFLTHQGPKCMPGSLDSHRVFWLGTLPLHPHGTQACSPFPTPSPSTHHIMPVSLPPSAPCLSTSLGSKHMHNSPGPTCQCEPQGPPQAWQILPLQARRT